MKLKRSFFKSGLIKQDLRQHGWIAIVFFIFLLFAMPLELLQLVSRDFVVFEDYPNYLMINTELQIMMIFSIPIAAGLLLFRYLQNETSVDMIHSLPIKRVTLYINHVISGLLLLFIPIVLISCITYFVTNSLEEFESILTVSDLISWTGLILLLTSMMFIFTVSVGMMTGMSSAQAILTYIFLFLPIGLTALVSYNLTFLLFGFSPIFIEDKLAYLSPFFRFIETWSTSTSFSPLEITIYLLLTICLFFFGIGLYKARQLEQATEVITFSFLRPVFKYAVTFCSMILGGSYFSISGTLNWNWIIFGYISGALIGYTAAEMILKKTWRIFQFRVFTGFIGYSILFTLILISIKTDLLHYEQKLPRMDQISEVFYGNKYDAQELLGNDMDIFSDSKLYIQDVRQLHEYILDEKNLITSQNEDTLYLEDIVIAYRLNNGKRLTREYSLPVQLMEKELQPVMEAEPYKRNLPELHQLLRDDVQSIRITPSGPVTKQVILTMPEEIKEFKQVLENDLLSQTFNDFVTQPSPWAYIEFSNRKADRDQREIFDGYNIEWKKSYDEVSKWLDEHGYLDDARVNSDDILSAELTKIMKNQRPDDYFDPLELFENGEQYIKINDKKQLSDTLEKFTENPNEDHTYYIKFILKDGNEWFGALADADVPAELVSEFK